jgi:transcriptional regulator with XRE-family HTH domain
MDNRADVREFLTSRRAKISPERTGLPAERDLTQEQVAVRAQVAVSTLRKIESGRVVEPAYFTMLSLADALGGELHEIG